MKRRSLLKTMAAFPVVALRAQGSTQTWLGPEYWANPMQDWRRNNTAMECFIAGGDRNVFWLTKAVGPGDFAMSVKVARLDGNAGGAGWVGFRFGMRGFFNDYRDTAVRGLGVEVGVTGDGRLFIDKVDDSARVTSPDAANGIVLTLAMTGGKAVLTAGGQRIEREIPVEWKAGGVALVCHSGSLPQGRPAMAEPTAAQSGKPAQQRTGRMRVAFSEWKLSGAGVIDHPERALGPILFNQYTLSRGLMKMNVQLVPLEGGEPDVELVVGGKVVAKAKPETASSTALFQMHWDDSKDTPYTLVYRDQKFAGTIRRDPKDKDKLVVGALTCQGDFGYPHAGITRSVAAAKPDLLLFTGDQLYEANGGYGIQRGPLEAARIDYLRKWYLWGWAWRDLIRDIPCVTLPDDHDVYHGNVWGAGGRRAEYSNGPDDQQTAQDSGGYTMPAAWVNIVQRTQSAHLPNAGGPAVAEQGIAINYSHLVWGGVSFAILEDRKFKSAPKTLLPEAKIRNGWVKNPQFNSAKQSDVAGAQLLGEAQEKFLADWAKDRKGVWMNAVVSATLLANLCTLPPPADTDAVTSKLPVEPVGGYAEGEIIVSDYDSNGWPQTPRNRVLRIMASCGAIHLCGDQHLASTVQYGIDDFEDGPWAFCTPAISNIFPRRWYPQKPGVGREASQARNMGGYFDGFGNRMTVHAVANPQRFNVVPKALSERAPGFGIVEMDRRRKRVTLINYPRWADLSKPGARPYAGWPVVLEKTGKGWRKV